MNELLREELTPGASITLGGQSYALAFPMTAVIHYKRLTGDSLFQAESWSRIDMETDPGRFLAALWSAIHGGYAVAGKTEAKPTLEELGSLVDFRNARAAAKALAETLASYILKRDPDPNAPAPAAEPATMEAKPGPSESASSGRSPDMTSA